MLLLWAEIHLKVYQIIFLPKRDNLILSSSIIIDEKREDNIIKTFDNVDAIIYFCNNKKYEQVWVIGGQLIYETFIKKNIINNLFITKINNEYVCDKYFYYDEKQWKLVSSEKINNKENLDINLFIYEK